MFENQNYRATLTSNKDIADGLIIGSKIQYLIST